MSDLRSALEGLPAEYGGVTPSDRPDLADFQSNGALAAAKTLKRNPRDIATAVARRLEGNPALDAVGVAGPGFINLTLSAPFFSTRANALAILASAPTQGTIPPG